MTAKSGGHDESTSVAWLARYNHARPTLRFVIFALFRHHTPTFDHDDGDPVIFESSLFLSKYDHHVHCEPKS
jgi:hypothetical protein